MFMLKGCPRCHGDLYQDRDIYGEYAVCLQCGYYLSDREMEAFSMGSCLYPVAQEAEQVLEPALVA